MMIIIIIKYNNNDDDDDDNNNDENSNNDNNDDDNDTDDNDNNNNNNNNDDDDNNNNNDNDNSGIDRPSFTPLSHERLVANAHELGTCQDSLGTSQDGLGRVLARPCMSRQVTEIEREIPFFSHRQAGKADVLILRLRSAPTSRSKVLIKSAKL